MYYLNLKQICRKHKITLSELAKRSAIPQPSLSRYSHRRSDITLRQLGRIALALGVNLEDIVQKELFTEKYKTKIRKTEQKSLQQDKTWVSSLMSDLQQHYRKVSR